MSLLIETDTPGVVLCGIWCNADEGWHPGMVYGDQGEFVIEDENGHKTFNTEQEAVEEAKRIWEPVDAS